MTQARIDVLREVRIYDEPAEWQLCFQWCRYRYGDVEEGDEPVQYGYRFIWRRPGDGSLQAARGQARLSSVADIRELIERAETGGWGNRNGDTLKDIADRLRKVPGCEVDLTSGYVGWKNKDAAAKGRVTAGMLDDIRLIQAWTS